MEEDDTSNLIGKRHNRRLSQDACTISACTSRYTLKRSDHKVMEPKHWSTISYGGSSASHDASVTGQNRNGVDTSLGSLFDEIQLDDTRDSITLERHGGPRYSYRR